MIAIDFLLTPLVACLLLILINVYFGIHVIRREIIFIDISLAQIAALGSVVAMVIFQSLHPEESHGHAEDNFFTYAFSLVFIVFASFLFAWLRNNKINIPLEAIIGITYAVATTATVIILDKAAGGDVHVHDMLIGSILWVSWHRITLLAFIVIITGLFHIFFRKKFLTLTDKYNESNSIRNRLFWDFLFYLSFGIVIIEAVNVAGILTVFALLIIPASIAVIAAKSWMARIFTGWGVGLLVSLLGLYISWTKDLPCSPVIISILGIVLVIALAMKYLFKRSGITAS